MGPGRPAAARAFGRRHGRAHPQPGWPRLPICPAPDPTVVRPPAWTAADRGQSGPGTEPVPRPFSQPGLHQFADLSVGEIAERAGLKRIDLVAWRDFDDPEAGGSELHAHRVMTAWAEGRHRRVDDHVVGPRRPHGGPARRLPGRAPGRALRGVPADDAARGRWAGSARRRPGRDLERHALLLAPVGPLPAHRLPPPRPRRDVEDGPPRRAGRERLRHRAPAGPSRLPPDPDRDPVLVVQAGDRRPAGHPRPRGCRSRPRVSSPSSRPAASAPPSRWWRRSAGWCRSSGSTCSSRPWSSSSPSHPEPQGRHRR